MKETNYSASIEKGWRKKPHAASAFPAFSLLRPLFQLSSSLHFSSPLATPNIYIYIYILRTKIEPPIFLISLCLYLHSHKRLRPKSSLLKGPAYVQWKFPLDMLDCGHMSNLGHVSESEHVQWKFPLDISRVHY